MIISASRRTDIPAFYTPWFMNRIAAGYCTVPNPFNRNQVTRVSLLPEDVAAIVFWTRNPRPLLARLDELDARGFRCYFQYTILDYSRALEPKTPPVNQSVRTFRALADRVGPARVIWRYDPIVLSQATDADFHRQRFVAIARQLRGSTQRVVVSVMDRYKKIAGRLQAVAAQGIEIAAEPGERWPGFVALMADLAHCASEHGMAIESCAEKIDLAPCSIRPGRCIDDALIQRTFGIQVAAKKDPSQREACGCVVSRDIGMYDSCLFGCQYCYATSSFERAQTNYAAHEPDSPSLLGRYDSSSHELSDAEAQSDSQPIPCRARNDSVSSC